MVYTREYPFGPPRRRRWSVVSWWFSLVLLVPLLTVAIFAGWGMTFSSAEIEGRVVNSFTGDPVSGARVTLGERQASTGDDGQFGLSSGDSTTITVSADEYASTSYEITDDDEDIEIALRPSTVAGTVTDRVDGGPLAGIQVDAVVDGESVKSTETVEDGGYELAGIPDGAELVFDSEDFAPVRESIDQRQDISVSMRPDVLTGTVADENGEPIQWATVAVGDAWTETREDGTYRLEDAPGSGQLVFKASGYEAHVQELDDQLSVDVTLTRKEVKAIYVTANAAGDAERFDELLDMVERTELNAMVIDIKDSSGQVFYDSNVELANEVGAVNPAYDVAGILAKLEERDIYAIARQVIMEDPVLAEAREDLAIGTTDGDIWRTWNGIAWLNAYEEDVWDYNIELMMEAVELGFDEIQYDYVRFPSDGPLEEAEYGVDDHNEESRGDAIAGFLARAHEAITPTRAYLAADIFGLTLWELGDGGIGQNLEKLTPHLDYINPMIYPSHFYSGSMGFEIPNDHPYEVILYSLQNGAQRIPEFSSKIRPWLQDFSYGEGREYGPTEVHDQINASEEFGAPGWMLWNASSSYQEEALEPSD